MKLVLVGNPNCGKTSIYNGLAGTVEKVGNYSGVSIDIKHARITSAGHEIIDIPGLYSLVDYTEEEKVSADFLKAKDYDVILNIIDMSNLRRSLYMTFELVELQKPMIIILNMADLNNVELDEERLSAILHIPIIKRYNNNRYQEELFATLNEPLEAPRFTCNYGAIEDFLLECSKKGLKRLEVFDIMEHNRAMDPLLEKQKQALEKKLGRDLNSQITLSRYHYVDTILHKVGYERQEINFVTSMDRILIHPLWGLLIFFIIMGAIYYLSLSLVGQTITPFILDQIFTPLQEVLRSGMHYLHLPPFLVALLLDGVYMGIEAVMSFLPQLFVLFFFLSLLEANGYMAKVAILFDRLFSYLGLSGRSVIPFIIGSSCTVPGLMSLRTLDKRSRDKMYVLLPLVPCSAKLPVILALISVIFNNNMLYLLFVYLFSILMVMLVSLAMKVVKKEERGHLVIELPKKLKVNFRYIYKDAFNKTREFLHKAGTIILIGSTVIFLIQSINFRFQLSSYDNSILAGFGNLFLPLFRLIGIESSIPVVAFFSGAVAKEQIIATLNILLGGMSLNTLFTPASALAYIVLIITSTPCLNSVFTTYQEIRSLSRLLKIILLQFTLAFSLAFITYRVALLFS